MEQKTRDAILSQCDDYSVFLVSELLSILSVQAMAISLAACDDEAPATKLLKKAVTETNDRLRELMGEK